jgi:hypothetical protein
MFILCTITQICTVDFIQHYIFVHDATKGIFFLNFVCPNNIEQYKFIIILRFVAIYFEQLGDGSLVSLPNCNCIGVFHGGGMAKIAEGVARSGGGAAFILLLLLFNGLETLYYRGGKE